MNYFKNLENIFENMAVNDNKERVIALDEAITKIVDSIIFCNKNNNKVIIIGNGGSASIASHIQTDLIKNASINAASFNDPSLITCLANDLGFEFVFKKPIEVCAKSGDMLIAISSSGKSENILQGVDAAKRKDLQIITLSGFDKNNPLRRAGELNFYIPSGNYGHVEIAHLAVCHFIVDSLIKKGTSVHAKA